MGLFDSPWLSKEDHERFVHLNLIGRVNMLEMNNSELQAKLQLAELLITELQDAFREIYEVYAGSNGFIPETCAESYQQQLIEEMADIAAKHMRKGLGEK
jgi:hypothetical protein